MTIRSIKLAGIAFLVAVLSFGCTEDVVQQEGPTPAQRPETANNTQAPAQRPAANKKPKAVSPGNTARFIIPKEIVATDRMLEVVPADTAYAWATIGPQDGATGIALDDWSGFYDAIGSWLQSDVAGRDEPLWVFVTSFLNQLRGHYDTEGFAALGLSASPRFAVYALGAFPVARIEIQDPKKVLETILRAERWARVEPSLRQWKGKWVRVYAGEDWHLAIALTPNEILVVAAPELALPIMYPLLFGDVKPGENLATSGPLGRIALQHGDGTSIGFVDFEPIVRALSGEDTTSLVYRTLRSAGHKPPMLGEVCTAEVANLVATFPGVEFVSGNDERGQWGTLAVTIDDPDFLNALHEMRFTIPGVGWHGWETPPVAFVSLGIDMVQFYDWLDVWIDDRRTTPFACETLLPLNTFAADVGDFAKTLPPWLRQIEGGFAMVTSADIDAGGLGALEGSMLLGHSEPELLWNAMVSGTLMEQEMERDKVVYSTTPPGLPMVPSLRVRAKRKLIALSSGEAWRVTNELLRLDEIELPPLFEVGYHYGRLLEVYFQNTAAELEAKTGANPTGMAGGFGLFQLKLDVSDGGVLIEYHLETQVQAAIGPDEALGEGDPEGENPEGESPEGETPQGEAPAGETPDGETPAETADGANPAPEAGDALDSSETVD